MDVKKRQTIGDPVANTKKTTNIENKTPKNKTSNKSSLDSKADPKKKT